MFLDSSFKVSSLTLKGLTITFPSAKNSIKLNPPKVAAYWSCFPPASFKSSLSILYAKFAISYSPKGKPNHSLKAPIIVTTKVDEVPKPEPAGASTKV